MKNNNFKVFFLLITFALLLVTFTTISAGNVSVDNSITSNVKDTSYPSDVMNEKTSENVECINENKADTNSNKNLSKENSNILKDALNSNKSDTTTKTIVKNIVNKNDSNTKTATVSMDIPLDKSRPIYFAMDHTSKKDKTICNNIVNTLKNNGFKVMRYSIGPNAMYSNMVYVYNHNLKNAILFHLFNGVDPSNIREVAKNGNDNRGRIVRSRGNDVVLAWFYDSSDCIHTGGSCYKYVRGSETGRSMSYPKQYMDNNNIRYICTSSDRRKHTSTADYTGTKTVQEFMKLFNHDTQCKVTKCNVNQNMITVTGTVTSPYAKNINGIINILDNSNKIIKSDVKVNSGSFSATFKTNNPGLQYFKINYLQNMPHKSSSTTFSVNVPKNVTFTLKQVGDKIGFTRLEITVKDDKNSQYEKNREIIVKDTAGHSYKLKTNNEGWTSFNVPTLNQDTYTICYYENGKLINSIVKCVSLKKSTPTITISPVVSQIGKKIILQATLRDEDNRPINGGNLVFKINSKTIRIDMKLSDKDPLKISVVNGIAKIELIAESYMKNTKISATYSGSARYNSQTSDVVIAKIT